MPSFLDSLEDEEKTSDAFELPGKDDSSFLDTLDDKGVKEDALLDERVTTISSYEPTIFDKMRNMFSDPGKEA
ncbi:hypothetical protein KAR48_20280, partial [bacterium]|nr:hypothetical protein [bacterium]